jgi:hypothetical protein
MTAAWGLPRGLFTIAELIASWRAARQGASASARKALPWNTIGATSG